MAYPPTDYAGPDRLLARTWQIETSQARRIAELADGLALTHSSLVRLLLGYALDQIEAGALAIDRQPVLYKAVIRRQ